MANVTITQLPAAQPLTGTESVPVVQNGVTVQTTTGAIANAPVQTQTFLTVNNEPTLPNSRYFAEGLGIGLVDNGAQSYYRIALNGVSASLETATNGFIAKTGATVTPRALTVTGNGISVTNGDGQAGNPVIQLTGLANSIANQAGNGLIALNNSNAYTPVSIVGVSSQIAVTNGNAAGAANPTIGLSNDPIVPGVAAITVPTGNTAQRPSGVAGQIRYNTDLNQFEGYSAGAWRVFSASGGISTFSAGTTGLLPNTPTGGTIVLSGVVNTSSGGTGVAGTLSGYVKGNGSSPMTSVAAIPTSDISGLGTMAIQNANSVAITGGSISGVALTLDSLDNTPIGVTTPSTGFFTGISATSGTINGDTIATLTASQILTNKTISGSSNTLTNIGNSSLTNSAVTINGTTVNLGGSVTVTAASPNPLTIGTGLSGSSYNGVVPVTIAIASTGVSANTYGSASQVGVFTVNAQGQLTSASNTSIAIPSSAITDKGMANGVASLDATGKVPTTQLPSSVIGGVSYQGTWNATTNTPALTSSVGTNGYYYLVSVGGTTNLNGINLWTAGDWAVFNGSIWEKVLGSSAEAFQSITVTGLTGYMYANGSSAVTASTSIPTTALSGTITNSQLANSTISGVSLGSNLNALSLGTGLTGVSYNGSAPISTSIDTAVVATLTGTQTLTNKTISGSSNTLNNIGNSSLTNSSITINGTPVSLGGSVTVTAASAFPLTIGTGLSGTSYNGSAPVTITNTGVTSFSTDTTGLTVTASTGNITLGGTLNVANGGTGVTASSGPNSVVLRDANANENSNAFFAGFTSVAASGTQIVLAASSTPVYVITGSGGQTIKLPDATTLPNGAIFSFNNNQTSGAITVNNNSNTLVASVPSGGYSTIVLLSNASAAGSWDRHDQSPSNVSWSTNTFNYSGSITGTTWNGVAIGSIYGGTGQTSYATGDTLYASATNTLSKLTGNTTATKKFLTQTGTGSASAAPAWGTVSAGDISGLGTMATQNANSVTITGGTIDGVTIGGTTPAAGTFTVVTATSGIYGGSF
jgi:trimeric autotransporter adhesin